MIVRASLANDSSFVYDLIELNQHRIGVNEPCDSLKKIGLGPNFGIWEIHYSHKINMDEQDAQDSVTSKPPVTIGMRAKYPFDGVEITDLKP